MDKKDLLGKEIKSIMEEETSELFLSESIKLDILNSGSPSLLKRLNDFLNIEVELPIIPIGACIAAAVILLIVPIEGFLKSPQVKTIDLGSSQVIIRDFKEVSKR